MLCADLTGIRGDSWIAPRVGLVLNEWNFSAGPNISLQTPHVPYTDFGGLFNGFNMWASRKIWQISDQSTVRAGGMYLMQVFRRAKRSKEFGGRNFTQNHLNATLSFQRDINVYTSWYITTGAGAVYVSGTRDGFVNPEWPFFPYHLSIGIKQRIFWDTE